MRGFASSVLSCRGRERLGEETRSSNRGIPRCARNDELGVDTKRDSAKVHGVVNSTLRYVPGGPGRESAVLEQVGPEAAEEKADSSGKHRLPNDRLRIFSAS